MGLGGRVAWITSGDEPNGRAIALELSSRGVKVFVTGANERALGEVVGEVAFGGGKARHFVTSAGGDEAMGAALARLVEVFGAPTLVVFAGERVGVAAEVVRALGTTYIPPDVLVTGAALPAEIGAALRLRGAAVTQLIDERAPEELARAMAELLDR
jgi:NAD(P)-dependent dehydrogenase (short-subunit alcohol dehydrogenase family)